MAARQARADNRGQPALAEHVCLALIAQGVDHGWGVGTVLASDGELGRIWTLSRPLTYRAIDLLVERGFVTRRGTEQGRGRDRTILRPTAAGRRAVNAWLDAPVEHLRDVRTELLVKLVLRERAGLPTRPLVISQQNHFADTIDVLTTTADDEDLVDVWRRESARAVRRFLDEALNPGRRPSMQTVRTKLRLSARNQLAAVVGAVTHGDVMSTVKLILPDGQRLTAAITKDAAVDLDVAPGDDVVVIIKSTEVILAKPDE
jgi:molybdopterin-binding protein